VSSKELTRLRRAVKEKEEALAAKKTKRKMRIRPPEPYRSWFEVDIAIDALKRGVKFDYEKEHLVWLEPEKLRKYKPDYFIERDDRTLLIVEAKGRWTADDRKKMCCVTEQNPDLDIRILFERDNTLSKNPKSMRYTEWCAKKGITCAVGRKIPEEWLD